jgi:serine/threonine-protein kinase
MSLIGRSIGNYAIKAKLGEGGMGAVYLGEHPMIGKRVAVKVLREALAGEAEIVRRFFNEAKAVNDIGHQNIVDIVDFGKAPSENGGEIVYIIMEYLDGASLAARNRAGLRLPEVLEVIQQCCSALSASHKKGIVHRDLKPDNIFLCNRGGSRNFVKVLDFGIAKLTGGENHGQTRTGTVMGTPYYMSPEQCEGKRHIDQRSDVYSMGVVMYELLTGRVPFPGEGFGEIIVAHLTKPVIPPSSVRPVPQGIEAIVLHALEKDPARRFQSMDEFAMALSDPEWHLSTYVPSAVSTTIPPSNAPTTIPRVTTLSGAASEVSRPVPRSGGRAGLWIGLGALVLAAAGGGAFVMRQSNTAQPAAAAPAPTVQTPTVVPSSGPVKIKFTSEPSGARVERADGTFLGTTPATIEVARGSEKFDVGFHLDSYNVQRRTVPTDTDREVSVALVPTQAPAAPKAKAPVAARPKAKKSSTLPMPPSIGDDDGKLLRSKLLDN